MTGEEIRKPRGANFEGANDMNKKFILALMLASGMAFAQTSGSSGSQSTPGSTDQQQPSQQTPSTSPSTTSPSSPSTTTPSTTDQSSQSATSATSSSDQNSVKGCLKQSGGNWVLSADNGQTVNLQGDSSMLKPHDGHQVQVQGTRASDGSLQVSSVNMISDSCTNNQASSATGSSTDQSASATSPTAQ